MPDIIQGVRDTAISKPDTCAYCFDCLSFILLLKVGFLPEGYGMAEHMTGFSLMYSHLRWGGCHMPCKASQSLPSAAE